MSSALDIFHHDPAVRKQRDAHREIFLGNLDAGNSRFTAYEDTSITDSIILRRINGRLADRFTVEQCAWVC